MSDTAVCTTYEGDLSAWIDGELAPERAAVVRAHLEGCPSCTARVASLRRVDAALASIEGPVVRPDLAEDLRRRIAAEAAPEHDVRGRPVRRAPAPRRRFAALRPVAALAAACAFAVALWALLRAEETLPGVAPPEPPVAVERPEPPPEPAAPEPRVPQPRVPEALANLDARSEEELYDLALVLELETVEDIDVISNLELLEALLELEGGTG